MRHTFMTDRHGLTLVEIILAIALVGIIAVGLITAFSSQLTILVAARGITNRTFDQQADTEEALFGLRSVIQSTPLGDAIVYPGATATTVPLSLADGSQDWDVPVQKLEVPSVDSRVPGTTAYVSRTLAEEQLKGRLSVQNVRIDVSVDPGSSVANLELSPSLIAQHDDIVQPEHFLEYLYYWWRSYPGLANPVWPRDYERVASIAANVKTLGHSTLVNTVGANRYVKVVVSPVDIHGMRGMELDSSFAVFLQVPDWRLGQVAWVDKNGNGLREAVDVEVPLGVLTAAAGFDSADGYFDESLFDTSNGDLYVPMWIGGRPSPQPASPAPIAVAGSGAIDWTVDRAIHLAKGIDATNGSNISLRTRLGNIALHQFSELANNIYGPFLSTSGDILLSTLGRGSVYLNSYSVLQGRNINLLAKGDVIMDDSQLQASRNIVVDATQDSSVAGNRDVVVRNSTLRLMPAWVTDRTIDLRARTAIRLSDTAVVGNTHSPSTINLLAQSTSYWVDLQNVSFENINIRLSTSSGSPGIQMQGGGWSEGYSLTIGDGRTLLLGKYPGPVNNLGHLNLGSTGKVRFVTSMNEDLARGLALNLSRATAGAAVVEIAPVNYSRNLGYAGSSGDRVFTEAGAWYDLGTSEANLAVSLSQTAGDGILSVSYAYDGNGKITLSGTADGAADVTLTLTVRDKYSERAGTASGGIEGTITLHFSATEAGPASITVDP